MSKVEVNGPPTGAETRSWAERREDGSFRHVHPSKIAVRVGCSVPEERIVEVLIREGKGYWAWWGAEEQRFSMVWPTKLHLECCFSNGTAAAEEAGRGKACEVEIVEVAA